MPITCALSVTNLSPKCIFPFPHVNSHVFAIYVLVLKQKRKTFFTFLLIRFPRTTYGTFFKLHLKKKPIFFHISALLLKKKFSIFLRLPITEDYKLHFLDLNSTWLINLISILSEYLLTLPFLQSKKVSTVSVRRKINVRC